MTPTNSCISTKPCKKRFHRCRIIIWIEQYVPYQHEHSMLLLVNIIKIETSFKEGYFIKGDEIVRRGVQSIWVVAMAIISTMTKCILNLINVVVKCWRIGLACGTSGRSFILTWNVVGSMWQNVMGATCGRKTTKFLTIVVELSIVLISPYIDYERLEFSMSLSKLDSWFSFGLMRSQLLEGLKCQSKLKTTEE